LPDIAATWLCCHPPAGEFYGNPGDCGRGLRERRIEYTVRESKDPAFIEGRRADVIIKDEKAGIFGELHPEVISNFGA